MFQIKEEKKYPNETEINNSHDKEFKATVIRRVTELGKRIDGHNENFNKELENIKKKQTELEEYNN